MRSWMVLLVVMLALVGAAGFTSPALGAVDPHAKADGHPPAVADGHGGAKDDAFSKALDLGLWTIVVFLILLMVLGRFAWGPMMEGLKAREESIASAIEDARKAREEAQREREQFQKEIAAAHEKTRLIVEEAHKNAQRTADEMLAKARSDIAAERDRLRREITLAQDQALQQIWHQAAMVATEVSSKVIQRQMSQDDHRRLVDEALQELQVAKNGNKG